MGAEGSALETTHDVISNDRRNGGGVAIWRRRIAGAGLIALVALAAFGTLGGDQLLAGVAFVGLAIATVLAWVELGQIRRRRHGVQVAVPSTEQVTPAQLGRPQSSDHRWAPIASICITAAVAAGAVQS